MRTYARGRVCAAAGCATVLSVYNGSAFCALHDRALASRPRRALHPARERACDHCGTVFETRERRAQVLQRQVPDGSLRAPQARRDKAGKGRMTTDWL